MAIIVTIVTIAGVAILTIVVTTIVVTTVVTTIATIVVVAGPLNSRLKVELYPRSQRPYIP